MTTACSASPPRPRGWPLQGLLQRRHAYDSATTFAPTAKDRVIKGSRNPHSKGVKSGGRLYYRGNVDPGWGRKPVTIQKKNCKSCGWHSYKTVRTSRTGGYSARIYAPSSGRWYFRSTVRATKPHLREGHRRHHLHLPCAYGARCRRRHRRLTHSRTTRRSARVPQDPGRSVCSGGAVRRPSTCRRRRSGRPAGPAASPGRWRPRWRSARAPGRRTSTARPGGRCRSATG